MHLSHLPSVSTGKILQQFDYAKEEGEKEFCCASTSPSGQSIVLGSFDQLRLFNWSPKRESWEEGGLKHIPYLYTITAVSWKRDGAKIVAVSCREYHQFNHNIL